MEHHSHAAEFTKIANPTSYLILAHVRYFQLEKR